MTFVRASDFCGGRARVVARTVLAAQSEGTLGVRLTDANGSVFVDEAPYIVEEPPAADPAADDDGRSRLRVPDICEVYARLA